MSSGSEIRSYDDLIKYFNHMLFHPAPRVLLSRRQHVKAVEGPGLRTTISVRPVAVASSRRLAVPMARVSPI